MVPSDTDNIKKDMMDQTEINNPIKDIKEELDESIKDIN